MNAKNETSINANINATKSMHTLYVQNSLRKSYKRLILMNQKKGSMLRILSERYMQETHKVNPMQMSNAQSFCGPEVLSVIADSRLKSAPHTLRTASFRTGVDPAQT